MSYPPDSLPWWKSRVIVGALVSAVTKALVVFGVIGALAPPEEAAIADVALLLAGIIGDAVVVRARVTQKFVPPITG